MRVSICLLHTANLIHNRKKKNRERRKERALVAIVTAIPEALLTQTTVLNVVTLDNQIDLRGKVRAVAHLAPANTDPGAGILTKVSKEGRKGVTHSKGSSLIKKKEENE